MAKKKKTKDKELEFKKPYLNKQMNGKINGIELPKLYKDFTKEEKEILYFRNPEKAKHLFIDVSFVGKRKVINKIDPPKIEHEPKEENKGDNAAE
jgi:hypothetical protein